MQRCDLRARSVLRFPLIGVAGSENLDEAVMKAEDPAVNERRLVALANDCVLPQKTHLFEHVQFGETVRARIEFGECIELVSMPLPQCAQRRDPAIHVRQVARLR